MNLSITNLHRTATTAHLRELFAPYGAVQSATLLLDRSTGRSRGAASVEMRDDTGAALAVAGLNNTPFMRQTIGVRAAAAAALAGAELY